MLRDHGQPKGQDSSPRELLRENEVVVYLSGVKKPPPIVRWRLIFRASGLSKPIVESRRADSNR